MAFINGPVPESFERRVTATAREFERDLRQAWPAVEWRTLLDRVFAFGGALLLSAAAVFFLAYNWEAMHRFARLALVDRLLACASTHE